MSQPRRILLLVPDAIQLRAMQQHLSLLRFEVRTVDDAETALKCTSAWLPDLFICDYEEVGSSMSELVAAMRDRCPLLRFIVLKQQGHTLHIMRSVRKCVVAFLTFPFSMDELAHSVNSVLDAGETSGANRREHGRILFSLETHCVLINPFDNTEGRPVPALIRDVSRSGVSIIVRQILPVPAMLKLVIQLEAQSRPIEVLARSVSCMLTQIQGVYRMGLRYIGLLPDQLTDVVRKLGMRKPEQETGPDIYMGKPFSDAVREWLAAHQNDGYFQPTRQINEIAADVCRAEAEHDEPASPPLNGSAAPANGKTNGNGNGHSNGKANGHGHGVHVPTGTASLDTTSD